MVKIKNAEVLSLDTSKQKEVLKETKQLKKKIKDGTLSVKQLNQEKKLTVEQRRGLIFISHLPHGFYEEELTKYFRQFGKVTHVQVCRSGRTGNSKGYGYIEFENPEVAKIAAETMNNYLMFKKRIVAEYVPPEKRPKGLFSSKHNTPTRFSAKVRREKQYQANLKMDTATLIKRTTKRLSNVNKKLAWLEKIGVKPTYTPVDIALIKQQISTTEKIENPPPRKSSRKTASSSNLTVTSKKSKSNLLSDKAKEIVNITASPVVKKDKMKKKVSRGISKKSKKQEPLNANTVKKIARELIKKSGKSLLTRPIDKSKSSKKKSTKK